MDIIPTRIFSDVIMEKDYIYILASAGDGFINIVVFDLTKSSVKLCCEKQNLPLYPLCCALTRMAELKIILICAAYDDYSLRFYYLREEEFTESEEKRELELKCKLIIGEDWTNSLQFCRKSHKLAISNNDHLVRVVTIAESDSALQDQNRLQV